MSIIITLVRIAVGLGAFALMGCASLSQRDCLRGSWSDIGFRDGRSGRVEDRIGDHAKACGKYGIEPDRAGYFEGREAGLKSYCTRHSGFEVGRAGDEYESVCSGQEERAFLDGYGAGQALHDARERLDHVEYEIGKVEKKLKREDVSEADRETLMQERIVLEGERGAAQEALRKLDGETQGI